MFGTTQIDWLLDSLSNSEATFKIIAGGNQFLNPMCYFEGLGSFARDRERILTGLSEALAIGVRDAAENGGDVNIDGSTLDRTLALLREINERDANHTITRVLQNLVSLPPAGPAETPLETIIEVVAEVNRQVPNEGGSMSAADHFDVFESVHHFLTGEIRGIERIYQVVQNREIAE